MPLKLAKLCLRFFIQYVVQISALLSNPETPDPFRWGSNVMKSAHLAGKALGDIWFFIAVCVRGFFDPSEGQMARFAWAVVWQNGSWVVLVRLDEIRSLASERRGALGIEPAPIRLNEVRSFPKFPWLWRSKIVGDSSSVNGIELINADFRKSNKLAGFGSVQPCGRVVAIETDKNCG